MRTPSDDRPCRSVAEVLAERNGTPPLRFLNRRETDEFFAAAPKLEPASNWRLIAGTVAIVCLGLGSVAAFTHAALGWP